MTERQKFQVCFIMPHHRFVYGLAFKEVLFLLRNSLTDLGYDAIIKPNILSAERTNIIVGYNLLSFSESLTQCRIIPWQLEHLEGTHWYDAKSRQIFDHASDIWDFSTVNVDFLAREGYCARHLPPGYHPSLRLIRPALRRDIDVLFYGVVNERREPVLRQLGEVSNLKVVTGVFGEERDALIARSRIVLNLHYHESRILESVRISYLLNNDAFVISEDADDNPWPGVELVTAPYEDLVKTCRHYLAHEHEREERRRRVAAQFRARFPMTDLLRPVLEGR